VPHDAGDAVPLVRGSAHQFLRPSLQRVSVELPSASHGAEEAVANHRGHSCLHDEQQYDRSDECGQYELLKFDDENEHEPGDLNHCSHHGRCAPDHRA